MNEGRIEVEVTHDPHCDMAYIELIPIQPGDAMYQHEVELTRGKLVLDLNDAWQLIGIEVFEATRILPDDFLGATADPPK